MIAIVILAFAAHVVAWIVLPSGKKAAPANAPVMSTAGINISHA